MLYWANKAILPFTQAIQASLMLKKLPIFRSHREAVFLTRSNVCMGFSVLKKPAGSDGFCNTKKISILITTTWIEFNLANPVNENDFVMWKGFFYSRTWLNDKSYMRLLTLHLKFSGRLLIYFPHNKTQQRVLLIHFILWGLFMSTHYWRKWSPDNRLWSIWRFNFRGRQWYTSMWRWMSWVCLTFLFQSTS